MKKEMLINAVHPEQKRMAILDDGKLVEFNIQMAVRDPINGNIYKGIVQKVERGLQAAFVNYGGKKDGFLPLRDVNPEYFHDGKDNGRASLKVGQEVIVQVLREVGERKGALLTTYISLPGRYLVLLPNKPGGGISRKIEDEEDRRQLKELIGQIKIDEGFGYIIRTAGMSRTKQELARDYQHLSRLWKEILKAAATLPAPSLIYQETDFGVRSLRDYFTSDMEEILVDDLETFRKMRAYCRAVAPRNLKIIKHYKDKTPLFNRFRLEEQIGVIYQEQANLKSGGYIVINPTEAMITIDVNSGRGSNKRNVEETAFKTNMEAAEEIARQLRLRDLGGLIAIDFIDMRDRKHEAEVEKAFKKALSLDRSRIQLSRISKFGILELSRQKKQSTIQEISYTSCPYCKGRGSRPSLEYTALSAFRKIESHAVQGQYAVIRVTLPHEISDYLLNQKRQEIGKLEAAYDLSIVISGRADLAWDEIRIDTTRKETPSETDLEPAESGVISDQELWEEEGDEREITAAPAPREPEAPNGTPVADTAPPPAKKKSRRRSRHRRKKTADKAVEAAVPTETTETAAPAAPVNGEIRRIQLRETTMAEGEPGPETADAAASPPDPKPASEGVEMPAPLTGYPLEPFAEDDADDGLPF